MIRIRPAAAVAAMLACAPAFASPPAAVQKALDEGKALLLAGQYRAATDALEKAIPHIDGNAEFLGVLRQAYTDELKQQNLSRRPDRERIAVLRERLAALGATTTIAAKGDLPPPTVGETPPPPADDPLKDAGELFRAAKADPPKYAVAATLYARAYAARAEMTADQLAAWAYCRVRAAADRWNASKGDKSLVAETTAEVEDALKLAPEHAELQKVGRGVLAAVTGKPVPGASGPRERPSEPPPPGKNAPAAAGSDWFAVESDSVRVRHTAAHKDLADAVLKRAEEQREAIFRRWSGPQASAWNPKCDIVIHPDSASFAAATQQPPQATGHALVKLSAGRPTERRLDLRADDPALLDDALPRELTHVVLADLFPDAPPPAWAAYGMAVLAASPAEVERHLRAANAKPPTAAATLFAQAGPPADVTGFGVASVGVVDYLVRLRGDKSFKIFLADAKRYGAEQALQRQYRIASAKQLDADWQRAAAGVARGQAR